MFNFNAPIKMCTRRSCCPTIEFAENDGDATAIIKDDFGGKVILSIDELELMTDIYSKFKATEDGANNEQTGNT